MQVKKNQVAKEIAAILGGELDSATLNHVGGDYYDLKNEHGKLLISVSKQWNFFGFLGIIQVGIHRRKDLPESAKMLVICIEDECYHLRGFRADHFDPQKIMNQINIQDEGAAAWATGKSK